MRLHVLETQGIPPNSILSVKSGSSRRQQLIPCQAPFKLEQPPVPVELDVLTCRAKGHEVCSPGPCEKLLKVPMSNGGKSMSVTFRVRKVDGEEDESCHTPKLSRKDKESAIEAYLVKHDLHSFMKEVFQGLTAEQPEDPFLYIGRCLQAAAARDVGSKAEPPEPPSVAFQSGPVLKAASRPIAREQQACTMQRLRRKARDALSKGYLDGRLHSTLCSLPEEHEAELLLQTREPGTAQAQHLRAEANVQLRSCEEPAAASGHPIIAAQRHSSAEAALSPEQRLRRKARDALSKGYLDGRLQSALRGFAVCSLEQ
ncbi:HET-E1, partial [Symbiodinium microadriaticum]